MNEADRNSPQINPDIQETAQKLFSEISQLIAEYLTVLPPKELLQAKLQQAIASAHRRLPSSEQD